MPVPMSAEAVAISSRPSTVSTARALVFIIIASQTPDDMPQPISSRMDRGSCNRLAQPKRSAPAAYAARSSLLVNCLFSFSSVSA